MSNDDLPEIHRGDVFIARAMTKRDGEVLIDLLNGTLYGLREQLLGEITDVIEQCFETADG